MNIVQEIYNYFFPVLPQKIYKLECNRHAQCKLFMQSIPIKFCYRVTSKIILINFLLKKILIKLK